MARKAPMVIVLTAVLVIAPTTAAATALTVQSGGAAGATSGTAATVANGDAARATTGTAAPTDVRATTDFAALPGADDDVAGTVGDLGPGLAFADLRADGAGLGSERLRTAQAARRTGASAERDAPGDEPVLLVHGFADTGYTPWWIEMTDDLGDAGYEHGEVFVLNLGAIPGSTVDSPEDYGAAVCDAIDTVKAETGANEVDVVAHSMGGLDARHCIEKQGGAEDVDDLVTLGTPHQGTYAAYLAYITPGARDMVPGSDFLTDLNDGQLADSVEYTAVWSDWDELINPDEYAKLPAEERNSVPNARNVYIDDTFHVQLVWDDDVFDAWIEYLD